MQRERFLSIACGDDPPLREELVSLLAASDAAEEYFDGLSERLLAPAVSSMALFSGSPASPDLMGQLQAKLAGAYRLERELRGGGMSRVFVAEDLRLGRQVVLKVLPSEMVPTTGAGRFQGEIELLARLQHPHIVPLLAADTADGIWYYTMPLVAGESLRDRLSHGAPFEVDEALRVWRDMLDALAYAHASGIVHRDIKPGNILLSGRNALVTDFGIAHAIDSAGSDAREAGAGLTFGTPSYMAPEQRAPGYHVGPRIDIYQSGLVVYEMLAGHPPFDASDAPHSRTMPEPEPLVRPDTPAGLVAIIMRCLATEPSQRPQSVDLLLEELDKLPTGPVPSTSKPGEAPGRPPWRAVALGGAALALAGLALVWLAARSGARDPSEPTSPAGNSSYVPEIAAYEWYQRGMDRALLRTDSGAYLAVDYFGRAIALDPGYAAAHAGLARMYVYLWNSAPAAEKRSLMARAEQAAQRAVTLDDSDADALTGLGWVRLASRRYDDAADAFERALRLNARAERGHEGLARVYMMLGRRAEQLAQARLGVEVSPASHSAIRELALALATNGRCDEALDQLRPLKTLTPPAAVAGVLSGMCYGSRGRWQEAIAEFQWAAETPGTMGSFAPAFLGHALARVGRREEAGEILDELLSGQLESHGAFGVATVYAGMGDHHQAFEWLERAIDDESLNQYIMHPIFADLHRDPRFAQVRERMELPP